MKPLILTLVIAVITTTIGAGWIINHFHAKIYSNSTENNHNVIAFNQLGHALGSTLENFPHRDEFATQWTANNDIELSFQDRSEFLLPSDIEKSFKSGKPLFLESEGELSLHLYLQGPDQVMSLLMPIETIQPQGTLNLILTLFFYLLVVAVLLAWLYPLIKRLIVLQKAANQLGTGDLSSRVSATKYSYIASIENDFNRMANQIQKLVDDNQLLSRAVSHNLKTPITRLRMGVDVLEEATEKSDINNHIKRINYDLDEMESLVKTLLQYSSLDQFKLQLRKEPVDLCEFIPRLIENENTTDIKISTYFSNDSIIVDTDPQYLAMCLANIVSNALQHTSSTVQIRIEKNTHETEKSTVSLSVEDDGCGIAEIDLTHVTKPFWRGTNNPTIRGHGMGLAIVARISEWLDIDLLIGKSPTLGGASISLLFRRA